MADRNRRAEAAKVQTLVAALQASAAEAGAAAAEARAAAAEEVRALVELESTKWHGSPGSSSTPSDSRVMW